MKIAAPDIVYMVESEGMVYFNADMIQLQVWLLEHEALDRLKLYRRKKKSQRGFRK